MIARASLISIAACLALGAWSVGASAADAYPNGCVSCHVVTKDKGDQRISTLLKAWTAGKVSPDLLAKTKASMPSGVAAKGKHPSAADSLEDIPALCLDCHTPDSRKAPPFARLMHMVHLTGAKNGFVTQYKGDCMTCHKLNQQTGEWSTPSGAEK